MLACGGARSAAGDPGAAAADDAGATTTAPAPVCGTSNVVTGQRVWGLQLAIDEGLAYYTTYGDGADMHEHALWSVPVQGGAPALVWRGPAGILGSGLALLDGVAYLSAQLQWGASDEGVFTVPETGGQSTVVAHFATECAAYGGMAFDATNLYAASNGCPAATGQILALPRAGGPAVPLWSGDHAGDGAAAIAMHGSDLYFLRDDDDDGDGALERLALGSPGAAPTEVTDFDEAHGLAVDDAGAYVTVGSSLLLVPFDGSTPIALASHLLHPGLVAVDATGIYVALGNVTDGPNGSIVRVPHGGGAPQVLASGQPAIFGLALDDVAVYWASQTGGLVARAGKCL